MKTNFTKEQLQPFCDIIYKIIDLKYMKAKNVVVDEFGEETEDEYSARITTDAIHDVLNMIELDLASVWFSFPEFHVFAIEEFRKQQTINK